MDSEIVSTGKHPQITTEIFQEETSDFSKIDIDSQTTLEILITITTIIIAIRITVEEITIGVLLEIIKEQIEST